MAMWNLSGDDVQRAKEELKGRRAAIQARYDSEMKQLETAIADIETFERAAVNFVANFKGEEATPVAAADTSAQPAVGEPAAAAEAAASGPPPSEPASSELAPSEPAPSEPAPTEKGSSRWRMRLSGTEATP